ncbi:hypothetical protein BaRGS_00011027 [Batillaria attramentaria]|uniref:Uncharacterized protein n=1 Tax=Batillaria attramentaria TaxID=370345 RepID=A0ABD0LE91_9CAEN
MERTRQLFCACEQGDVDSVQTLLDQGSDVDSVDDDENTPLQVASANGHESVVRLLIMRGAGLDKRNVFGWTPLLQASRYGHTGVVALLVQHQADIHAKNRYGASALTLAARGGHIQTVKLLAESGVDLNGMSEGCEFTPLLAAALHGHDAVLRFLLDRGCDVNFRTPSSGLTPLMLAALNGHMTTAQILIEKGGDPNVTNVGDRTALGVATVREAAKHGDMERIREILDQDPSQKDASSPQDGATPLMFAAMTGRLDVAELLFQRGKKQVAMFLLNAGADVSVQAKNGCTAFDMASLIDDVDTELLRMLAAKALHVNKADKGKKGWNKHSNGSISSPSLHPDFSSEEHPKSGLKAWWNRLSNRFRNLKLGRTFTMTNRLSPMPLQTSTSVQDLTLTGPMPSQSSPQPHRKFVEADQTTMSMTSYESMLLETKKSASVYTLDINPPHSAQSSETLKPVKPPFLPPPSFALDGPEHSDATASSDRSLVHPMKVFALPRAGSGDFGHGSLFLPSPHIPSARSSATLGQQTPSLLFMPRKSATASSAFRTMSNTTSPNSSTKWQLIDHPPEVFAEGRKHLVQRQHNLHPDSFPIPYTRKGKKWRRCCSSIEFSTRKRNQETVDMEAFLTLTDEDLKELGIPNVDSRRRERPAVCGHNDVHSIQHSKHSTSSDIGTDSENLMSWNIQDDVDPHLPSAKSRSS